MNHWSENDDLFADGHYIEDWELTRFETFSPLMQAFVREQARQGNKVTSVCRGMVVLQKPPECGVLGLPDGLAFVCPVKYDGVICYGPDRAGVIVSLDTYDLLYPTGLESPPEPWKQEARAAGEAWLHERGLMGATKSNEA